MNRAPSAPSMTRWSYDSDSGSIVRGANSLPFHTGFTAARETPRMATSGALMMGVNAVPPIPPSDEMVNVAPVMSFGPSLPSRALPASSAVSFAISRMPFLSASLMTGTTSPWGVSAAKPMFQYCLMTRLSPSSELLTVGYFFSAATTALIRNASGETFTPALAFAAGAGARGAAGAGGAAAAGGGAGG